jgi:preprotein translocase subunit SecB
MSEQQAAPSFSIQKLYLTDVSLEAPNSPAAFMEQEQAEITVQFQNQARSFDSGFYEVSLKVTVQAKIKERTLFIVEATQAGLFAIENIPQEELDPLLGIGCPTIIFPYLRETVSDLTTRAGFPPFILQAVNFEAFYMQQKAAQANENAPQTTH